MPPVISLRHASARYGARTLWQDLSLDVRPGEYFAVLGGNGTGKTTLLKALLGLVPLSSGTVEVAGKPAARRAGRIGYVPQQHPFHDATPLRGRDLVGLGVDGHRWGVRLRRRAVHARVDELLELVGATHLAEAPVGELSGGEQQRLRIAQALAADPQVLLCDEPLLSLDLNHQRAVSELIDRERARTNAAVVFVTHEINPIIDCVDRILYLADGAFTVGTPDEVLRSEVLTRLYGSPVEVIRRGSHVLVVGTPHHRTDQEEPA